MKWRRWKIGLAVATLAGVLQALVAIGALGHPALWPICAILATNVGTNLLLFLKDHPLEQVVDEPETKLTV